jgi:hypothetical protein
MSTINMGKCASQQSKKIKEICMRNYNSFRQSCFWVNNKKRTTYKIFGAGDTMEGELWSVIGVER